ncbi:MAG: acyl-CoA/acyl-ACP dehydrogenase [Myxococcales bacterium]|nr:acyl-CoA/acyl-ACP dehydrogenase [Myxococcales bacterium]
MNFAFSEEQEAFRETLRRFLEEKSPTAEVFRLIETPEGHDPAVWKQMAAELGLQGLPIPEAYGGQGFGFLELGIALEEMGRVLLCSPYFSSVCLAASAVLNAASEKQRSALLPGIASGETIATLALLEESGSWDPASVGLEYAGEGDDCILDGGKRFVTDAAIADLVVVSARAAGTRGTEGIALLAARTDAAGIEVTPVEPLDPTRRIAHLHFSGVRAERLGPDAGGAAALAKTLDQACACLAAESTGGMQHCLDSAVDYAKSRVQFARPIGSFQAIKHKCAEVLMELESARAAACYAIWAAAEENDELPLAASLAKSFCGDAYLRAAAESIQIHGGIGFTWEADPQLHYKRALSSQTLLGDPSRHRARIAELKGF